MNKYFSFTDKHKNNFSLTDKHKNKLNNTLNNYRKLLESENDRFIQFVKKFNKEYNLQNYKSKFLKNHLSVHIERFIQISYICSTEIKKSNLF